MGSAIDTACAVLHHAQSEGHMPSYSSAVGFKLRHFLQTGLWDIPLNTPDAEYLQRLNCTLNAKPPGTLGIYRLNSMYSEAERDDLHTANLRLQQLNRWTVEAIRRYNCGREGYLDRWHIADFAPAMYQRPELARFDRVHYTGVGSRTYTLMLLNVIAEATERLGNWETPKLPLQPA